MHKGLRVRPVLITSILAAFLFASCGGEDAVPSNALEAAALKATTPVDPARELLILDTSVVEDPIRTTANGAWTFQRLMQNMAKGQNVSQFTLAWLALWETDQTISIPSLTSGTPSTTFTAVARPNIRTVLTDPWLVASGCAAGATVCNLDFSKAPFRLTAIVNRIDKRPTPNPDGSVANAGEGRFVFDVTDQAGNPLLFTVIFEFELPAHNISDVNGWAKKWHALGTIPFGPSYNTALQKLTDAFSGPGVDPNRVNGSGLDALRTNEVVLAAAGTDPTNVNGKLWEIRSHKLSSDGSSIILGQVAQTPDLSFNGTTQLADLLNANQSSVLAGTYQLVPSVLGASAPTPHDLVWAAPGVPDPVVRAFAINTCNGCHRNETNTSFTHIGKRARGQTAVVSNWLSTIDLPRRVQDLTDFLNGPGAGSLTQAKTSNPNIALAPGH